MFLGASRLRDDPLIPIALHGSSLRPALSLREGPPAFRPGVLWVGWGFSVSGALILRRIGTLFTQHLADQGDDVTFGHRPLLANLSHSTVVDQTLDVDEFRQRVLGGLAAHLDATTQDAELLAVHG